MPDHSDPPAAGARQRGAAARGSARAWLALQCAGALRPRAVVELLRANPDPVAALACLPAKWRPTAQRLRRAERDLARCGARLVPFGAPAYPRRLLTLADAAPVLAVRGDSRALAAPAVAIVGSRAASAYGLRVARQLAAELARAGVTVVSGLARGIDAAAHEGCLEAGGSTLAVQACGPDVVYPAAHRRLAERIAERGAVLSEFPPGTRPRPAYFPLRNRLISGLSAALVVVEARERSGSLVTARHAADQGIDVFAVPGPITAPTSAGTNALLRDGAAPLLEAHDVLAALAWPSGPPRPEPHRALSADARAILAALRHEPAETDALARHLGRAPASLAQGLLELELAGCVASDRDGRWRALC